MRRRCFFSITSRRETRSGDCRCGGCGMRSSVPRAQLRIARWRNGRDAGLYRPDISIWPVRSSVSSMWTTSRSPRASNPAMRSSVYPRVGLHTNGYSLARALIPRENGRDVRWWRRYADACWPSILRTTTRCVRSKSGRTVKDDGAHHRRRTARERAAHVAEQRQSGLRAARWRVPPIMIELVRRGNLSYEEKYRTLNMGVGYTLIVARRRREGERDGTGRAGHRPGGSAQRG